MKDTVRDTLLRGYTEPVRDPLWGHIYMTPALVALIRSPPFMRLHRIMQLGPVHLVYPGATHTRAGHSIGVYHLARRLLSRLVEEGADAWLSPGGAMSFLCAALLHDLGHFPYAHSLDGLPLEKHETLTGRIIEKEPVKSLVASAGGDPEFTAAIVDDTRPGGGGELLFYRRLLSGTLDPDKLDYLSRDALYCGVPYGTQDVDFILSRLFPHPERGVDIDSRGIAGVESLLFSKYCMYRAVYWHRAARAAAAMMKKALRGGLESGAVAPEELYGLDDQGLFSLAGQGGHPFFRLVDAVRDGRLFIAAAEIPFSMASHGKLLDPAGRSGMEEALAAEISAFSGEKLDSGNLILDLPGPLSFESNLFVTDEGCFFPGSTSAFKSGLIDGFVRSLRTVLVLVDPGYKAGPEILREGILHISGKWLQ